MKSEHHITILFDAPFWIALFESIEDTKYSVAKAIISTSEPKSFEIADFLNKLHYDKLKYTTPIDKDKARKDKISFKKQQKINKNISSSSKVKHTLSKAQTLLKEQFEVNKKE